MEDAHMLQSGQVRVIGKGTLYRIGIRLKHNSRRYYTFNQNISKYILSAIKTQSFFIFAHSC